MLAKRLLCRWKKHALLLDENDLLRIKLEAVPDGVLVVDENWCMVYFNQRFVDLWDIPLHIQEQRDDRESLQAVLDKLIDPEGFLRRVEYLMSNRELSCRDELELRDGRVIERYTSPLTNRQGQWRGRIWFFRDISERKRAEADRMKLERQQRQLEKIESLRTMAAAVAHNYNNFLTVILGNLELALRCQDPDTVQGCLTVGVQTSLKAARMGRKLLLYLGEACPKMRQVNCCSQVEEILAEIMNSIPPDISCCLHKDGPLPIRCDAEFLSDALATLIENSVEAMLDEGGKIEIRVDADIPTSSNIFWPPNQVRPGQSMCRITISDTGPGMDALAMRRIFDPFYSTREVGRGLGLSTVLGVARLHGGVVGVESGSGKGTSIHLLLPLCDQNPDRESKSEV